MEPADPPRPVSTPPRGEPSELLGLRWLCLGLLAVFAAWLVVRLGPPEVVAGDAPRDVVSAERAWVHLERVARVPHPSGSAAAREVEAYIADTLRSLGLTVELQAGPGCTEAADLRRCGHVRNVIGTLPGRVHDGALLLSAHYDSASNAPGAGDDGAAVAALLEVARAASVRGPLEHDVIFAFLDGEEDLLLGASQFCSQAELRSRAGLRSRVRLVANFDARGSRGAVTLIGASARSGGAIVELSRALSHPVLSSFYPSVASVLPNATDAEIYQLCGLETLSFAFAAGFENYHQGTDTPQSLDERSLQHHADYAFSILRRFADGVFDGPPSSDSGLVFFDVGALFVVRYPYALAQALALALAAATVVVVRRRPRSKATSPLALLLAAAGFALVSLAALGIGALVVALVTSGWRPWAPYVHAAGLAACAAPIVLAAVIPLTAWLRRQFSPALVTLGPLVAWVGLALLTALALPGASQLFTWPAAALLGSLLIPEGPARARVVVARALLLVPAVLMITPVIYTLLVVLGAPGVAVAMACGVGLLGAGAEPLDLIARRPRRASAALLALGGLAAVVLSIRVRSEPGPPTPNAVAYGLDSEAHQALWFSPGANVDPYERQFLGANPQPGTLPAFGSDRPVLMNAAPLLELEPPRLELVSDRWSEGERIVELRVRSPRGARSLMVWENTGAAISSYRFDGTAPLAIVRFSPELDRKLFDLLTGLGDGERWSITLISPEPDGSSLTLTTKHTGALEFQSADRSEGLAVLPVGFVPRSAEWTEGYPGDHTLVSGPRIVVAALPPPPR